MKLKILVTAGDGIGPEVTNEAVAVLKEIAAQGGHDFSFDEKRIGGVAIVQDGTPLPKDTLDAALASDAVLLGAVGGNEFNSLAPRQAAGSGPACRFARRSAGLPTCALLLVQGAHSQQPLAPRNCRRHRHHVRPRTARRSYFGKPREWNKEKGVAEHHASTRATKSPASPASHSRLAQKRRKKLTSVDKANVLEVSQLWRAR